MPLRKRKIPGPTGQIVEATVMPFQTGAENWNEYLVDDGTVIKMKSIAVEIMRVDGEYDPEGNPLYMVQTTNVTSVQAPDDLKRK